MKISKNQLQQIIKEELQAVLNEARVPLALRESDTADMFRNMGVKEPDTWKYLDGVEEPYEKAFGDKKKAVKKAVKKGTLKGAGKVLVKIATGPVGAAITGAEIAGHAIDLGVGGVDAKIGKAQYSLGGSEAAAYDVWAKDRLEATGKESPSYEQYLNVQNAPNQKAREEAAEQVKAEMENQ